MLNVYIMLFLFIAFIKVFVYRFSVRTFKLKGNNHQLIYEETHIFPCQYVLISVFFITVIAVGVKSYFTIAKIWRNKYCLLRR